MAYPYQVVACFPVGGGRAACEDLHARVEEVGHGSRVWEVAGRLLPSYLAYS